MPSEISGGMKKRVGIARAIVNDSKYLFCDEPNSGLDPVTAIKIDDLILELTKKLNTTTIVVTHDMNSVIEIGEYIIFLHNGKKLWEGDNKNILKSEIKGFDNTLLTASDKIDQSTFTIASSVKSISEASSQLNSLLFPIIASIGLIVALQITIIARRK